MQVEVNEANIDKFKLAELTGNTREFMLSAAADAAANGHILSCEVPDDQVLSHNVFDIYESEHVDPQRLNGCGYEKRMDEDDNEHWVCVVHGKTSRRDVLADPHAPCLQVDPNVVPTKEEALEGLKQMPKTCVYNKIQDPAKGTVHICAVHGKTSKYDINRLPNMPCLAIEPKV